MNMRKVESSNIDQVGFDPFENQMDVIFKNGGHYRYENVQSDVYQDIVTADSVGSAFNRLVKTNPEVYPFTRLN